MPKRLQGVVLLVAGIVVIVLSLAADSIGVGANPGLGMLQLVGAAAGIAAAVIGVVRLRGPNA